MHLSKLVFFAGSCFGMSLGCSVINSFDDVKPLASTSAGGSSATGGASGAAGTSAGEGGNTPGMGGASGTGGAVGGSGGTAGSGAGGHGPGGSAGIGGSAGHAGGGAGGGTSGGAGGDSGGTGGSPEGGAGGTGGSDAGGVGGAAGSGTGGGGMGGSPPAGLIVVGGTAKDMNNVTGPVLTVLNPDSGETMASEPMLVLGVTHDHATDTWYILESTDLASGIFPSPTSPTFLHVRTFDPAAKTWTELSKRAVPATPSPDSASILSLTDRIVYVGYSSAAGDLSVIVLDTSNRAMVGTLTDQYFPLTQNVLGLAGKPSKLIGGNLEVIARETATAMCPTDGAGKKCDLSVTPITLGNAGSSPQAKQIVGQYAPPIDGGTPAWAINEADSQLVVLLPPTVATPGVGKVLQVDLLFAMPAGTPSTFTLPSMGGFFRQMTVEQCAKVAMAVDLKAARLYALPLDGSAVTSKSLSNSGQLLQYEPYTHTALTPFSSAGQSAFQAFTVVTKPLPVVFNERSADWSPPADLAVQVMATKSPPSPVCN